MTVKPIVHEIRIQNQVIFLDPPIEYARQTWVRQLHDWIGEAGKYRVVTKYLPEPLGVVCRLRRIQSSRYEIGLQMQSAAVSETTYTSLVWERLCDPSVLPLIDPRQQLTRFTDNTLQRPFALIENKVQQLKEYVAKWLQFQSLWDLEAEYVFNARSCKVLSFRLRSGLG